MTELNEEMKALIDKNLPTLVGEQLKKALIDYDKVKTEKGNLVSENLALKRTNTDLENMRSNYINVEQRERAVVTKENQLNIKDEILKVREEHAKQRVEEIRALTQTVFRSNRLGYNLNLGGQAYIPGHPGNNYNSTSPNVNISGNLTKE